MLFGIAAVAEELGVAQHVLRFWEQEFAQLQPVRSRRRRYYRPEDIELLHGIRALLHGQGLTMAGLHRVFRERGPSFVRAVGRGEAVGGSLDALAASLRLADLPPDCRDALIGALADPATCRALADQCLARGHAGGSTHA